MLRRMAPAPPADLLVIGHVTRDEIDGNIRLGGAASFAARAATALGFRVALVTAAPPQSPLLDELHAAEGLVLHLVPSTQITTFILNYDGPRRRLVLGAAAPPLVPADIPQEFRSAPVAYVGPVAGECGRALVEQLGPNPFVCVGLQGWLRRPGPDGTVAPVRTPDIDAPPSNLRAAVLSDEDHPQAEAIAAELGRRGVIVAVTRGRKGATLLAGDRRLDIPPAPAREVDPTGAGDVFAVVLALALYRGRSIPEAGALAAEAAARVVEGPGLGTLRRLSM
jgi:1D-myo-inositol 3-kinase